MDRARLAEPELFFDHYRDRLVCLDEIQLLPGFFAALRSEIDRDRLVFEIKLSKAPQPSRGFHELVADLQPEAATVIAPVDAPYEQRRGVWVMGLADALTRWGEMPTPPTVSSTV
jgi:hypothetical protein